MLHQSMAWKSSGICRWGRYHPKEARMSEPTKKTLERGFCLIFCNPNTFPIVGIQTHEARLTPQLNRRKLAARVQCQQTPAEGHMRQAVLYARVSSKDQ